MPASLTLGAWLAAGAALAVVYLFLLLRTVAAVTTPVSKLPAVTHFALRFALAAGVFLVAARHGAMPLLVTLVGFQIARSIIVQRARGA